MLSVTSADQLLPELLPWRRALDPRGVAPPAVWAPLERLSPIWRARMASSGAALGSVLTPSGYPLEFTFRSGSGEINYTIEPGLPDSSPTAKWYNARTLAGLGTSFAAPDRFLDRLRARPEQRFGCWLGVRTRGDRIGYKIYQEVTPSLRPLVRRRLASDLPALDPKSPIDPLLVGQSLPTGATEYYGHVVDPRPSVLHALLRAANAANQLQLISHCLSTLNVIPTNALRERLRIGLSYRIAPGQTATVTLFIHAAQIGIENRLVRRRVLALAAEIGLSLPVYERATEALEERDRRIPLHGLIGFTVEPSGAVGLSIGVRPPPLQRPVTNGQCDNLSA